MSHKLNYDKVEPQPKLDAKINDKATKAKYKVYFSQQVMSAAGGNI
jgi:hypothetical protein